MQEHPRPKSHPHKKYPDLPVPRDYSRKHRNSFPIKVYMKKKQLIASNFSECMVLSVDFVAPVVLRLSLHKMIESLWHQQWYSQQITLTLDKDEEYKVDLIHCSSSCADFHFFPMSLPMKLHEDFHREYSGSVLCVNSGTRRAPSVQFSLHQQHFLQCNSTFPSHIISVSFIGNARIGFWKTFWVNILAHQDRRGIRGAVKEETKETHNFLFCQTFLHSVVTT